MEDIDKVLLAFGLKLVNTVAAAIVSFASLRFFDQLNRWEKWSTFAGGWALAAWGAAPLREYLDLKPAVEIGFVLILGLFGMAIASEAIKLIRDFDWKGLITRFLPKGKGE